MIDNQVHQKFFYKDNMSNKIAILGTFFFPRALMTFVPQNRSRFLIECDNIGF